MFFDWKCKVWKDYHIYFCIICITWLSERLHYLRITHGLPTQQYQQFYPLNNNKNCIALRIRIGQHQVAQYLMIFLAHIGSTIILFQPDLGFNHILQSHV